jgi:hypothetical protein
MRKANSRVLWLAGAIVAGTLAQVAPSNAVIFDWSYTGGPGVSGGGTFDATFLGGVTYQLNSISGTANGSNIVGLSNYDGPNQLVYYPAVAQVDTLGFSFSIGDGSTSYNIYEDFGLFDPSSPFSCGGAPYCLLGPGAVGAGDPVVALTSFSATPAVPEPSTWAMLLIGFAGLGLAGRQWNKRAIVVALKD